MLLNSFVGVIYQGLRKVCATSGPCISTRTWFVLNGSPCLIELTRCGRKTNQPSSIAWRPLCQPTRCGRKTNQPSSIAWRPLCQPTHCGRKTKPSSVAWWPLCQATCCGRITNQSISSWPLCQSTRCGRPLSQLNCIFNSAVLVSNKVHQNGTILSVRSGTQNPFESLITGSKNCTTMLLSELICTTCSEYSLQSSINFEKGEVLKETLDRRRKRDREPSRIPLKRILKVLNKKKFRKKVQLFVRQSIPKSSFITNLSENHKIWRLWYNRDTFYSKYAFNMKTQKCNMRQKHCSCIHRCNNKSSLKGGMHHNTADSLWNCLSQRLAQIGLIPHDVGGSGDCFFKSVSHQLHGTADLHVEVRMAGISHLQNYPELYIESISDDTWENYIKQMSIPGTWCDHLIIQAVANAFNCVIHITESKANSLQATIITPAFQQEIQHTIFIGYINDLHYVSQHW